MKILPLQITFLGTGTGMPLFSRRPASVLCETPAFSCLVDMGPGIYHRLIDINVNPFSISYICLTHFHVDHTADLAVFLFALPFQKIPSPSRIKLIGGPGLYSFIQSIMKTYRLPPSTQNLIEIIELSPHDSYALSSACQLQTAPTHHKSESLAFRFVLNKMNFVYSGDTDISEELVQLAQNTQLFICEASFPSHQKRKGHLTPSLAGEIAQKANAHCLALTHFYPETLRTDVEKDCQSTYSGKIIIPSDGTSVRWSLEGELSVHEILSN